MSTSWSERLFGGLRRTSEQLGENLSGLTGKGRLDDDDLDRIEEALITADLGPAMGRASASGSPRGATRSRPAPKNCARSWPKRSRRCCARSPNRSRSTPSRARR